MAYTLAVTWYCAFKQPHKLNRHSLEEWLTGKPNAYTPCVTLTYYFLGPCILQAYQAALQEQSMSNTPHLQLLFPLALCKGLVAVFNGLGQEHPCTNWGGQEPCVLCGALSTAGKRHLQCSSTGVRLLPLAQVP